MINILLDKKSTSQTHSSDHPLHQRQRVGKKVHDVVIKDYNAFTLS